MLTPFSLFLSSSEGKELLSTNLLLILLLAAFLGFVLLILDRNRRLSAKDEWKSLSVLEQ
jgi:hypothetical protein